MSRRKNFQQSNWLLELSRRKNVEPRIVGIRSIFRGSTFCCLAKIRLKQSLTMAVRLQLLQKFYLVCSDIDERYDIGNLLLTQSSSFLHCN